MVCEEMRVPGLPGAEDVTDGNVDYYDMDWENIENGVTEPDCGGNLPEQSDEEAYEVTLEG